MISHSDIAIKTGESIEDYLVRIGSNLDLYGLTWIQATTYLNSAAEEEYSEAKWRKDYSNYLKWKRYVVEKVIHNDEHLKEIEERTLELQKQKIQFQDQKREYANVVRQQARFEHLQDEIRKSISEIAKEKPLVFISPTIDSKATKANVLWSDFHVGMDVKNGFNTYNINVFRRRFQELVSQTITYCQKHEVGTLTIGSLGDAINGAIHVSSRVQSSEDVIKQIQIVSEALAEGIAELTKHVSKIRFINIIGNHSRLISNKTESIFRENLEYLISWYLEARLKDFPTVEILTDTDGMFVDDSFEPCHVYVHGDLDHVSSVAKTLPQVLGKVPSVIFCGHIHHDTVKEFGRTKVISNGSLCGVDDYAVSRRLYAQPMQKMHIFKDNGKIEYKIDIDLQ